MPMSALDLEPPTPSPFFPRDLTSLIKLPTDQARALVTDYGLGVVRVRNPSGDGKPGNANKKQSAKREPEDEESREATLNKFLSYIGVSTHRACSLSALTPFVHRSALSLYRRRRHRGDARLCQAARLWREQTNEAGCR